MGHPAFCTEQVDIIGRKYDTIPPPVFCYNKGMKHCNECEQCGHSKPVLEVSRRDDNSVVLRFNVGGVSTEYDLADVIYDGQTDTSLAVDAVKRVLKFIAERHIDTLSARELGQILHLGDLGDVSSKGAETGSLLVYKKDDTCAEGCIGTSNTWEIWNARDNSADGFVYVGGYSATGSPLALQRPVNPAQYSLLGWSPDKQVSWLPMPTRSSKVAGDYVVCADKNTKQFYLVES